MKKSTLGVDVFKNELVVTLLTNGNNRTSVFSNNTEGFKTLHQWIKSYAKEGIIL